MVQLRPNYERPVPGRRASTGELLETLLAGDLAAADHAFRKHWDDAIENLLRTLAATLRVRLRRPAVRPTLSDPFRPTTFRPPGEPYRDEHPRPDHLEPARPRGPRLPRPAHRAGRPHRSTAGRLLGRADVPSGRSTGANEAHELRDGGAASAASACAAPSRAVNEDLAGKLVGTLVRVAARARRHARRARRHPGQVRAWAPTRCSASRWPRRAPRRPPATGRCTST